MISMLSNFQDDVDLSALYCQTPAVFSWIVGGRTKTIMSHPFDDFNHTEVCLSPKRYLEAQTSTVDFVRQGTALMVRVLLG